MLLHSSKLIDLNLLLKLRFESATMDGSIQVNQNQEDF